MPEVNRSKTHVLPVVERFLSLQGESTHAGELCYFIRLAGCNLRCRYCDTKYAWEESQGIATSLSTLVQDAVASGSPLVEVTGGEPLVHAELSELCQQLLDAKLRVLLETNGACSIAQVPRAVCKILDCKLPSSGMSEYNCWENYALLLPHDEVKFVMGSREDYDYAVEVIQKYQLMKKTANLLFSPVWGSLAFPQLAEWILADKLPVRMQIQMHKIIWGPEKTGV